MAVWIYPFSGYRFQSIPASGKRCSITSENTGSCRLRSDSSPFGFSTQECLRGTCCSQLKTEARAGESALLTFGSCTTSSQASYSTGHMAKRGLLTSRFVSHDWILQHLRKHYIGSCSCRTSALSSSLYQLSVLQTLLGSFSLRQMY